MAIVSGLIIFETREALNIEVEDGAHASTDNLGVEVVDGGIDNGDIVEIHGGGGANDGAEVTGVGRINENEVVGLWVELSRELGEFGNDETVIFGAENIEGFGGFDNFDVVMF